MLTAPKPNYLSSYWQNSFGLEKHLQEFLNLDTATLKSKLKNGRQAIAEIGQHFDWAMVADFYGNQTGSAYLFELGAWHLESHEYIGNTIRLIADHAQGRVLDFGGGIGTHTIAAALCPDVKQVLFVDINPINCDFVSYRAKQLGLEHKITCSTQGDFHTEFDTILCFDVLEHLPDPTQQLLEFHHALTSEGKVILNWYFSQGFNDEFPFHIDDPKVVENFFIHLQQYFLEIFHPYYLITARCYRKR